MLNNRHIGEQKSRENRKIRQIRKHETKYVILTDGEKTEENYFTGLLNSLQTENRPSLKIYTKIKAEKFVEKCNTLKNKDPFPKLNPTKIWVVFDRDRVENFDTIIRKVEGIDCSVAWSNPCIEEWFWAYFDVLSSHADSVTSNDLFKELFMTRTGKRYVKNLTDIYEIISKNGDEKKAIRRAEEKLTSLTNSGTTIPSEMYSATTVFLLVKELKNVDADYVNKTHIKLAKEDF